MNYLSLNNNSKEFAVVVNLPGKNFSCESSGVTDNWKLEIKWNIAIFTVISPNAFPDKKNSN